MTIKKLMLSASIICCFTATVLQAESSSSLRKAVDVNCHFVLLTRSFGHDGTTFNTKMTISPNDKSNLQNTDAKNGTEIKTTAEYPVPDDYGVQNQLSLTIDIQVLNDLECARKATFKIPSKRLKTSEPLIDVSMPLPETCKQWQNIYMSCSPSN